MAAPCGQSRGVAPSRRRAPYALPTRFRSTLRRIDPPEPTPPVELRQSLEGQFRVGPSFECLDNISGKFSNLRSLRPDLDRDRVTICEERCTGRLRPPLDHPRSVS